VEVDGDGASVSSEILLVLYAMFVPACLSTGRFREGNRRIDVAVEIVEARDVRRLPEP
jgi:hypothetical protein